MTKKKFLEKEWWLGVQGILTIIVIILAVIIPIVIVPRFAGVEKPEDIITPAPEQIPAPEQQEVVYEYQSPFFLPDENEKWRLNIDNSLLTDLYDKAHGLAVTQFQDAKLSGIIIFVCPYRTWGKVTIYFEFYSQWADRTCNYMFCDAISITEIKAGKVVELDLPRVTFDELPWLRCPEWPQALRKACEKAGPLSASENSFYALGAYGRNEPEWSIIFEDGITGDEFNFTWNCQGDPILNE